MKKSNAIRKCKQEEIGEVAELSSVILKSLAKENKESYFGGVDENEIRAAMVAPSVVFICKDEDLQGFLLLQKPSEEEKKEYQKEFANFRKDEALIVNGYGVVPKMRKKGIGTKLLEYGAEYAIENGFTQFIGTIHPENLASENALRHLSNDVQKSDVFFHRMSDGRNLPRQKFLQDLKNKKRLH